MALQFLGRRLRPTLELMSQLSLGPGPGHVRMEGDFARVFDAEDYRTMMNALDEATVVLRAHLVMEEFLNIWAGRVTGTDDLFDGVFVPFKTKLSICQNLGFDERFAKILDRLNEIRNKYSPDANTKSRRASSMRFATLWTLFHRQTVSSRVLNSRFGWKVRTRPVNDVK